MQAFIKGAMFLSCNSGVFTNDQGQDVQWQKADFFRADSDNARPVSFGVDSMLPLDTFVSGQLYDLTINITNSSVQTKDGRRNVARASVISASPASK